MSESAGLRTRIVRYDPRRLLMRRLGLALLLLVTMAAAFLGGDWYGRAATGVMLDEAAIFRAQLESTQSELESTRQTLVGLEQGARIDRDSLARVRADVASERERVARLEHEITVFKSLMDSSVKTVGLAVHGFEVVPGARAASYQYRLTLLQRSDEPKNIKGTVTVVLVDAAGAELPLSQIDRAREEAQIKFKFRYFQVFDGDIDLPDDFNPVKIRVVAKSSGRGSDQIDRELDWRVLED